MLMEKRSFTKMLYKIKHSKSQNLLTIYIGYPFKRIRAVVAGLFLDLIHEAL
jgi:hypothetical protein